MRSFTENEKRIIRKLIEYYSNGNSIQLGDLLCKLYPISWIGQNQKDSDFYRKTVTICYDEKKVSANDIYESINLFVLLIEKDYIVIKNFVSKQCIGVKDYTPQVFEKSSNIVETLLYNYYKFDLWELLCSNYYVTNSLIDFASDFKTVEQRRYENQIQEERCAVGWSIAACSIAFLSLVVTCCSEQTIDNEQFNILREDIKSTRIITPVQTEIVSPAKVDILTPIKTELRDTINVKNTK